MFEDVRHESLLKLSLSIKDADTLKQSNFSVDEKKNKNSSSKKMHRQRILKECVDVSESELYILLGKSDWYKKKESWKSISD